MGDGFPKQTTTVTIDMVDLVYLKWADDINASGLFRKSIRRRMRDDGLNPGALQTQLRSALDHGVTSQELLATNNRFELETLLDESDTSDTPS